MKKAKVEKKIGSTFVEASFSPNGIVNFWEQCRGKAGHSIWDTNTRTWQECRMRFGPQFEARLVKEFSL